MTENQKRQLQTFSKFKDDNKYSELCTKSPWRSLPVILAGLTGAAVISVPLLLDFSTSRVIHFMADDISKSAYGNQAQRQEHCKASLQSYKEGDYQIQIVFADQPEILREKKVTNILMIGKCDNAIPTNTTVGKKKGTSLILTLEYILNLIQSNRLKGRFKPIVVTITLQESELGPEQPRMDEKGLIRVRSLVESIIKEHSAIAIIGPSNKLQRDLQINLKGIPNVDICTFQNVADCVNDTFKAGRSIEAAK